MELRPGCPVSPESQTDAEHDDVPHDECGVFGVFAPGEQVSKLVYYGLYALQHRGQESAGMAVSNGQRIMVFKDMGLVSQVFDESTLNSLRGDLAIGHTRYSTTGASVWKNAQPTFKPTPSGGLALAHNGNLTNTDELEAFARARVGVGGEVPHKSSMDSTNDTSLVTTIMASYDEPLEDVAMELLPKLGRAPSTWCS